MSKWKCDICNLEFENFEARGFEGVIYCPLCYYKKLYTDTELERERLNNIIKEVREYIEKMTFDNPDTDFELEVNTVLGNALEILDKENI